MPQSIPKAAVLLEAAVKYLEDRADADAHRLSSLSDPRHVNVLNTVRRELELRGAQVDAERARLRRTARSRR